MISYKLSGKLKKPAYGFLKYPLVYNSVCELACAFVRLCVWPEGFDASAQAISCLATASEEICCVTVLRARCRHPTRIKIKTWISFYVLKWNFNHLAKHGRCDETLVGKTAEWNVLFSVLLDLSLVISLNLDTSERLQIAIMRRKQRSSDFFRCRNSLNSKLRLLLWKQRLKYCPTSKKRLGTQHCSNVGRDSFDNFGKYFDWWEAYLSKFRLLKLETMFLQNHICLYWLRYSTLTGKQS